MKLIEPSVQQITETSPLKKIELIGRTCYKSEDKITCHSAEKFVKGLINRKHYAMLEHAEITFKIITFIEDLDLLQLLHVPFVRHTKHLIDMETIYYVTVSFSHIYNPAWESLKHIHTFRDIVNMMYFQDADVIPQFITDVIYVEPILNLESELVSIPSEDVKQFLDIHTSYTFKFICDRGVSHELVRHRCSFAQESTRYCNYAKSKFGQEITFVRPANYPHWHTVIKERFNQQLRKAEESYMYLISDGGLTAQEARAVLPNALKTEVIMTAPRYQWEHFFQLRSLGSTGAPHPDMKIVADMAYEIFQQITCVDT